MPAAADLPNPPPREGRPVAVPGAFAPGPRVVEDGGMVAAMLAALAEGERANHPVLLPRRGLPEIIAEEDGFAVVLETSGTTGPPKRARHSPERLRGRVRPASDGAARWLLTYDPASFAGLQVIITAALSGANLVVGGVVGAGGADVASLARLASDERVTHVSGTPSFWRGFLLAHPRPLPPLKALTLGGEAVDQGLLDHLRAAFPDAAIRHIYASTEAGALFSVADGRAGFPALWLERGVDGAELAVREGTLRVRTPRAMLGYGDAEVSGPAFDDEGWFDTGDLVEIMGDRALFRGRADGRVNVGGVKVRPEETEALILAVEGVADALVVATPSPLVGHLLTATIVPAPNADTESLGRAVRAAVAGLPPAARPRVVTFADAIALTGSGKKSRVPT